MAVSKRRADIVKAINARPFCRAVLTQKRTLEAYLHPRIVSQVFGIEVDFGDQDDVSEMVARRLFRDANGPVWDDLSSRSRRRLKDRVKRRLHHEVLSLMTSELLAERDPQGEVIGWFNLIHQMAMGT